MRRMYSEKQIKALAKYVAINDLSDVDLSVASINASDGGAITGALAVTGDTAIGGDLVVNGSLEQKEANFEYDFSESIQTSFNNTASLSGATLTVAYAKVQQFNRILMIVASIKIENTTESSISAGSFSPSIDLTPIADKIFDQNGTPLSETTDANTRICGVVGVTSPNRNGSHSSFSTSLYRTTAKNVALLSIDYRAMNAGGASYTDLRFELIV